MLRNSRAPRMTVEVTNRVNSDVRMKYMAYANAKSILNIMMLAVSLEQWFNLLSRGMTKR